MNKTYKHKTLWWIAIKEEKEKYKWQYAIFNWWDFAVKERNDNPAKQPDRVYMMYPELIEWSNDREEVVEKDLVYDARLLYCDFQNIAVECSAKDSFRLAIEKCFPIQKKFTEKEVEEYYWERSRRQTIDIVCRFLKEHWLLAE